ncbi:kelch-like protein 9 [Physella acuta]|uniref:kelch-like protein 9 n=1 Tax=Physella acuta TaxID=109671 RepID=UPI0027DCEDA7|nr:kelch-like protein 9 [Physella acuta]XP_059148870.1 kelch-like protein 9 [Physella acuta]XP_059148871.1 kelch-like protein 9 [Physella acuta]XP_059148873.1 kelch-like protein 9 [Physella acuta]XP_059148874.1 kelch-like protein 9 [Physella acuta]
MMNTTLALHTGIENNVRFESTDHGKSVLAGLQHLREMQQLFDVILVAESREFPAHRVVLASCSDYFRAMFTDGLRECKESRVNLNGLTASSIANLIDFAYNSTINIDSDNVLDVLSGATHVQILPVINACENYLKDHLSIENCVNTANVAELFSLQHLQQHVFNFVCRNWATFSMCGDFHHLTPEFLVAVLSSGYPVNCKEIDVLMSILSWFSYIPAERKAHIVDVLQCIVFENISATEFSIVLGTKEWFELTDVCPKLFEYFPTLARLCTDNVDLASYEDTIISVTNYSPRVKSKVSVTRIELKSPPCKMVRKRKIPGLVNSRGFHSTIIVAGGFRKESGMTNNVMYLDRNTSSLRHLTKIPHLDQINFGMTVFQNQLYIVGGCFNDHMQEIAHPFGFRYSPTLDEWISIAPMHQERCRFLLCATEDRVYAIGGDPYASDVGPEDVSPCEVYNHKTNTWKQISPLPGNRSQLAGTSLGKLMLISGGIQENEEKVFQDFYQYEPRSNTWIRKADLLTPRADHAMFVWGGKVYVIGGWHLDPLTNRRIMATSIDCYDFHTNCWEVIASLNRVRTYGTYTLDGDCIYAIGGWCDGDHSQKWRCIDAFDLRFQTWVQEREQSVALWEHGACSIYLPKFVPSS